MSTWRTTDPDRCTGRRDPRVDLLRGMALLMIFFDHIPYNSLSNLTLRCFGFIDAAEIFVFLAGYSGLLAYSRVFERRDVGAGLRKIGMRCASIWVRMRCCCSRQPPC